MKKIAFCNTKKSLRTIRSDTRNQVFAMHTSDVCVVVVYFGRRDQSENQEISFESR